MDVTRNNFQEMLPLISKCIDEADFFAVDAEFTGLHNNKSGATDHSYDTLEERYHKIQQGRQEFIMLQFGLSAFYYIKPLNEYSVKTFNFYLFPVPFSRQAPDCRFTCQASSIDFLVSQGFDFNKVFREGISYISTSDELLMREKLQYRHNRMKAASPAFTSPPGTTGESVVKSPAVVPKEQKEFIANTMQAIEEFLLTTTKSLNLPVCSGFQRKLIYQTTKLRFHKQVFLETISLPKRERYIKVSRVNGESEFASREMGRQAAEVDELEKAVGFTNVIKMLSKSRKLIVGHNMYLDLIHIIHQFYTPLPEQYEDFKSLSHSLFPQVCDTKLMASMHPFREHISSSILAELQKYIQKKPFTKIDIHKDIEDGTSYNDNFDKLHEAGYDAFITGKCFTTMANYLGTFQQPPQTHIPPNSALLKPFMNKIFVMLIADIQYMDIVGKDLETHRDNVFHVKIHVKDLWEATDVRKLFSATGVVNMAWEDNTTLFVGVPRDHIDLLNPIPSSTNCTITPYNIYKSKSCRPTKARKRSFEEVDCPLPTSHGKSNKNNSQGLLNVDAVPFISRSISPIPEESSFREDDEEDLGEVVAKRQKMDDTATSSNTNSQQKNRKKVKSEDDVFQENDEWE